MSEQNKTAIVKALASMTVNLGNYESAKIEAGIELPVAASQTSVSQGFDDAWKEVYRQLELKVSEIKKGRTK